MKKIFVLLFLLLLAMAEGVNLRTVISSSTISTVPSNDNTDSTSTEAQNFRLVWIFSIIIILASFMAMLAFLLWRMYRKCSLSAFRTKKIDENETSLIPLGSSSLPQTSLIPLDRTVLQDQKFTSNPQYVTHTVVKPKDISVASVPLFNRNSITDLKKIGEGFFGEVYSGLLHSIDNEEDHVKTVAIKTLKQTTNTAAFEDFLREVEIISSFQHPNILTFVGVCPQENSSPPWMIFEYMLYGDLADVLQKSNPEFCDEDQDLPTLLADDLLSISLQISEGMEYLTTRRFVHRDLACRNCLVGSALTVKISDFGMCRDVYTCDYYQVGGSKILPIRWMSPEAVSFGKFTLESDVWSYGVVLWEIYSYGRQPYYGYTNEQVVKLIANHIQLEIPENCPTEVADIMRSCWQINPKKRINFLDICNSLSALKEHTDKINVPSQPKLTPIPESIDYSQPSDDLKLD